MMLLGKFESWSEKIAKITRLKYVSTIVEYLEIIVIYNKIVQT